MDKSREEIFENLKITEKAMLDKRPWRSKYLSIPADIKADLSKRHLHAYLNYCYAKQKYEYFVTLSNNGLNPRCMQAGSGYLYLYTALHTDLVVSTWLLIDKNHKTHGLLGLRSKINKYSIEQPLLRIIEIDGDILNSPSIKSLHVMRNNIVAHSNENMMEHIESSKFSFETINNCLDEVFDVFKIINDTYFDMDISKKHNLSMDERFIWDLSEMAKNRLI